MAKKLVICFDGTWNNKTDDPSPENDTNTNVARIYNSLASTDDQLVKYDQGVGSRWYDKVLGGAIGFGIDFNLMQGYAWLSDNYEDGDAIYLFGFSRGAYTARSLAGFIHLCGLLTKGNGFRVATAYEKYRHPGLVSTVADLFLRNGTRPAPIKLIGVWDTVGALGIPVQMDKAIDRKLYAFHDVTLHDDVEFAYHAVAVDEHRDIFNVTMWDPPAESPTKLEQRWFVGAHADVGGGYPDKQQWAQYTLRWMQQKALDCGLELKQADAITLEWGDGIHDSLAEFARGLYARTSKPFIRSILKTENGNEVIDDSVKDIMRANPAYQPPNVWL